MLLHVWIFADCLSIVLSIDKVAPRHLVCNQRDSRLILFEFIGILIERETIACERITFAFDRDAPERPMMTTIICSEIRQQRRHE